MIAWLGLKTSFKTVENHLPTKLPVWEQEKIEVSSSFSVLFSAIGIGHVVIDM
jgi:hypothetical protein